MPHSSPTDASPSQLRPDKKKAVVFQQKKLSSLEEKKKEKKKARYANIDTDFKTDLFLWTPPVSQAARSAHACDTTVSSALAARDTLTHRGVGLGQSSSKGVLFDNANTLATRFGSEDPDMNKQADLIPETQAKSPEENAAQKMGHSLEAVKNCANAIMIALHNEN